MAKNKKPGLKLDDSDITFDAFSKRMGFHDIKLLSKNDDEIPPGESNQDRPPKEKNPN